MFWNWGKQAIKEKTDIQGKSVDSKERRLEPKQKRQAVKFS